MAEQEGNATLLARTPVHDSILASCPWGLLQSSGESVGLEAGLMGNSEVGHLNLGAGRIVYQDSTRISQAVRDGSFYETPALVDVVARTKAANSRLHLLGLCSDGGVHSKLEHLYALLELAARHGVSEVFIHCFMDGRDTSPVSGEGFLADVARRASEIGVGRIATIVGRYYAMDRDNRWERVKEAYDALVNGTGVVADEPVRAILDWYSQGKTDEFIPPTIIGSADSPPENGRLRDGDGVIFFNFRADRARELTRAITVDDFTGFSRDRKPEVAFVTMTLYDESLPLPQAFPPQTMTNILSSVLAGSGIRQLRIAETEKYAHVTYFFNGGDEVPMAFEDRCLIPSPRVATYDLQPQMSAPEVTAEVISRLESQQYDVVIMNYANPDMVGHTGILEAAKSAIEVVDECVGKVLHTVETMDGTALITADHGNAEKMRDENGDPFTAHTTNPVHLILFGAAAKTWGLQSGILADVAPTILELMSLPIPREMTGKSLLIPR